MEKRELRASCPQFPRMRCKFSKLFGAPQIPKKWVLVTIIQLVTSDEDGKSPKVMGTHFGPSLSSTSFQSKLMNSQLSFSFEIRESVSQAGTDPTGSHT